MSRQTFFETFAHLNTPEDMDQFMGEPFSREKLMAEVANPGNIFMLAYVQDKPVGYAKMQEGEKFPDFAGKPSMEIARIYATTPYIGKGVGSALMQSCLDRARDAAKQVIWLGVWEKNLPAISFYFKWGFRQFGAHVFMLGNDPQTDWLMKKELSR